MNPADVTTRLAAVPPADVKAVRLLAEVYGLQVAGTLDGAALIARREALSEAAAELQEHIGAANRLRTRCEELQAIPSSVIPTSI